MHYDLNGNMRSFERYNDDEILKYKYLLDGNQLVRVKRYPGTKDSEGKVAFGIEEADNPFEYDTMGNLVYDGQNQLKISYDFLNLPEKIAPAELHSQAGELFLANYCYLWNGEKVASTDVRGSGYLYIGSVRYSLDSAKPAFESAPFAMGRIGRLGEEYDTRYFLNDHLGSVRAIVNQNGVVTAEYDYMPYGMQHKNSSLATSDDNTFRYNGKEFLSRFCVDLYDSQARLQGMNARFNSIDPLAEKYFPISPYAFCANNPINYFDPDGRKIYYAPGISQEFKAKFAATIKYMNKKGTAGNIAKLQASDNIYYINEAGSIATTNFDPRNKTINWDPDHLLYTDDNILVSPATILAHEADHAQKYDEVIQSNDPTEVQKYSDSKKEGSDAQYGKKEEKRVITGKEQDAARKHGDINKQQTTRKNHRGKQSNINISNMTPEEISKLIYESHNQYINNL